MTEFEHDEHDDVLLMGKAAIAFGTIILFVLALPNTGPSIFGAVGALSLAAGALVLGTDGGRKGV